MIKLPVIRKSLVFLVFMKIADVVLLSLSISFILIGVHQILTVGVGNAYWALMLALVFFFVFNLRRRKS